MFERCRIRLMTEADLPVVLDWRNHPNVRRHMFTQHEIGLDEHRNWFSKAKVDPDKRLLIVEEENQGIGYAQFSRIAKSGVADWGFYVRPEAPKGTGIKVGIAALNYAFCDLMLHKVCGQVIEYNQASVAFHQRLGFSLEGVLRDQQFIDGNYFNLHCFGLLAQEWSPEIYFGE